MSQISPESEYAPYQPPVDQRPQKNITTLRTAQVFQWLAMGWRDMRASLGISAFYGFSFWMMALVLGAVFRSNPEYVMSIASGCLLVGPLLAMGLYDVSRRREQGRVPELGASLTCWDANLRSVGLLLLVLMVLELLWGRASLVVFAVFFNTGMPSTTGVLHAVFNPENWEFVLVYALVGGAFAALVFSMAVVSIPMILDRDADAISAAITSLDVVFQNPGVMVLWGACIAVLVTLALLAPAGVGVLLVGPLLGHASWHAYRSAVTWPVVADDGPP